MIIDHVYAGARRKKGVDLNLWHTEPGMDYQDWYFNLWNKYEKKIILEVGAHDHFEDLRVDYTDPTHPTRNLFIPTGITPIKSQLPGFNTF